MLDLKEEHYRTCRVRTARVHGETPYLGSSPESRARCAHYLHGAILRTLSVLVQIGAARLRRYVRNTDAYL